MNLKMGGRKVPPITNQPWHTTLSPCLWHGTQLLLNILHMALLNPLQTDIIPDMHIVCFLSTLSTDINSMAVPHFFCWVIRHKVSLPVVWGQKTHEGHEQELGVQAYRNWHFLLFLLSPPEPPMSSPVWMAFSCCTQEIELWLWF